MPCLEIILLFLYFAFKLGFSFAPLIRILLLLRMHLILLHHEAHLGEVSLRWVLVLFINAWVFSNSDIRNTLRHHLIEEVGEHFLSMVVILVEHWLLNLLVLELLHLHWLEVVWLLYSIHGHLIGVELRITLGLEVRRR